MVSLVELRLCLHRCHDRGTCFAWPTEPEFGPICACDYLWEGRTCEKRQHNPWRQRQDENTFREEHLREHGVACGLDTIAQSCELCPNGSPNSRPEVACDSTHGECEWKQRDGDSAPGCHLKPQKTAQRRGYRTLSSTAGKGRPSGAPFHRKAARAGPPGRRHPSPDPNASSAHDRALDRFLHGVRRGPQALDKAGRAAMLESLRSGAAGDDEAGGNPVARSGKGRGGGKMRLTSTPGGVLEKMGIRDPNAPRFHHLVKAVPGNEGDTADAAKHEADSAMAERKIWKKRALSGLGLPASGRGRGLTGEDRLLRRRGGGRGALGGRAALQRRAGRGGRGQEGGGAGAAPPAVGARVSGRALSSTQVADSDKE